MSEASEANEAGPVPLEKWLPAAIACAARVPSESIGPDTRLDVIAMDSLTVMAVVVQAEVIYGFELTVEDVAELLHAPRVRDLIAVIERTLRKRRT